jgi:CDP-diacylglycerol---serine O-phosphatidyltransferase
MFNIPNLFTATNMLCGVTAIFLSFCGRVDLAPYFIFLGAILDFFDGFLARLLKQQGELGKQLDSLADMITFGLAPGVFMMVVIAYATTSLEGLAIFPMGEYVSADISIQTNSFAAECALHWNQWTTNFLGFEKMNFLPFCGLIIPFFSMLRLAKFNIDTRQSESFIGLPTPANTIFFTAFPLLLAAYGNAAGWQHDLIIGLIQPAVLIPIILIMSLMLIAELPLFALKFKSFKWKGNEIRYTFLISCGILIPVLRIWSIPIIVILYLLFSLINNVRQREQTKTNA